MSSLRSAGKLKRVLHCCPEVFTMHHRDLESIVRVFREKCLFTARQVTEILHRCPHVLQADPDELEYKFQVRWADRDWGVAVGSGVLRVSSVGKSLVTLILQLSCR